MRNKTCRFIYKNMNILLKILFEKQFMKITDMISQTILNENKVPLDRQGDRIYIIQRLKKPSLIPYWVTDDTSFEIDHIDKFEGAKAYFFDPSTKKLPEENKTFYFASIGLNRKTTIRKKLYSLEDILIKHNLKKIAPLFLKMDIDRVQRGFLGKNFFHEFNVSVFSFNLHLLKGIFFGYYYFTKRKKVLKILFKQNHIKPNNNAFVKFKDFVFVAFLELTLINKIVYLEKIKSNISEFNISNNAKFPYYHYSFFTK
jgi:hypothetical protein